MLTNFDKALVPLIGMVIFYINQKFGWHLPADDTAVQALFAGICAIVTYFIPNKAST